MKRAFYILFAFYFISLAALPCSDKEDCNETKHSQMADSQKSDHQDEACTPFCVCSCCAAHFITTYLENNISVTAEIATVYTQPVNAKPTSAVIPIWQPPKLS